ncbi:MAG: hypothetical protein QUS14_03700 [Pyrinomonadaceae bacterium]|nr:hypothetical protein [Pyrinomonadaceae bacterium]
MRLSFNTLKYLVILAFAVLFLGVYISSDSVAVPAAASSGGAPTGRTGAPGESSCTSCHSQTSQTGQFGILAPSNYVPGQTYTIEVRNTTADTSRLSWGFSLTALTAANANAGTFANINTFTRIRTGGGRNYMTQTTDGTFIGQTGGSAWTFNWTAPASNVGPVTFYAAGLHADDDGGTDGDQTYTATALMQPGTAVVIHHGFADFDGDGKADLSIFRPSTGIWYMNRSASGFAAMQWGIDTDLLTPADFDGDDKTDLAVWREGPAETAAFYILESATNTVRISRFGQTGDDPSLVGDWDGDGKADPAVFRNSVGSGESYFYYRGSAANPSESITYLRWGQSGDRAVRGDYDGDGTQDAAVYRPSNGTWYIRQSSSSAARFDYWGVPSDTFVNADFDGDSKTDLAVYRSGVWWIKQSSNGQTMHIYWGLNTDKPVPADYDADGKTDAAIYRNGVWYIRNSGNGSLRVENFGLGTDEAVPNAFVH